MDYIIALISVFGVRSKNHILIIKNSQYDIQSAGVEISMISRSNSMVEILLDHRIEIIERIVWNIGLLFWSLTKILMIRISMN